MKSSPHFKDAISSPTYLFVYVGIKKSDVSVSAIEYNLNMFCECFKLLCSNVSKCWASLRCSN